MRAAELLLLQRKLDWDVNEALARAAGLDMSKQFIAWICHSNAYCPNVLKAASQWQGLGTRNMQWQGLGTRNRQWQGLGDEGEGTSRQPGVASCDAESCSECGPYGSTQSTVYTRRCVAAKCQKVIGHQGCLVRQPLLPAHQKPKFDG